MERERDRDRESELGGNCTIEMAHSLQRIAGV